MEDINLLENQLTNDSALKTKHIVALIKKYVTIAIAVFLVLSALFFGSSKYLIKSQKNTLAKIEESRLELIKTTESDRDRVVTLQSQIENLKTLLPTHYYWHEFITLILASATEETTITGLNGTTEGFLSLTGLATDFPKIADFTKLLSGVKNVKSVKLNSSSLSENDGKVVYLFDISIAFDIQALQYKTNE